jgi:hypothetical protein
MRTRGSRHGELDRTQFRSRENAQLTSKAFSIRQQNACRRVSCSVATTMMQPGSHTFTSSYPAKHLAVVPNGDRDARLSRFHRDLAEYHHMRLAPAMTTDERADAFDDELRVEVRMRKREHAFLEQERRHVRDRAAAAPHEADAFIRWFEALRENGPGQGDPLFPWLAEQATLDDVRWFLSQEVAGEAGFDDLVALTQIKMPIRPKLELARNYWEEMGRGHESGMHGPLLDVLANHLGISRSLEDTCWQSLALGNLMIGLASDRHYAWHSIGALGGIEFTAPDRAAMVNDALRRLDLPGNVRRYFALHATLDVKHSRAWNDEVIAPLVAESPECAHAIAEGALMRLEAGARCFDRYRRELQGPFTHSPSLELAPSAGDSNDSVTR